jgi:hypothetical protein
MRSESMRNNETERYMRDTVRGWHDRHHVKLSGDFLANLVTQLPAVPDPVYVRIRRWQFSNVMVACMASIIVGIFGLAMYMVPFMFNSAGIAADSTFARVLDVGISFALATHATMAATDMAAAALIAITVILLSTHLFAPVRMGR